MGVDSTAEFAATWVSLLPPLVAIGLALSLRQVIPALFCGVWVGAWALNGFTIEGLFAGLLESFQMHVLNAAADADHAAVILFSFMIGGTIGIITRNGGMLGIVNLIVGWADNARRACVATATMGLAIFFDDYANTLVVGNTMRSVTDSMKISRAKLAYIVDSTAAPVACIALVTTWIGYEVGLIGDALSYLPDLNEEAYLVFLASIPYSFYPILAIAFVFMVAGSGLDFGPMLESEKRALVEAPREDTGVNASQSAHGEAVNAVEGKPRRALNAIVPILVMILGVMAGLYITGRSNVDMADPGIKDIIGAADSYKSLMWASLVSAVTAGVMTLAQRILTLDDLISSWFLGMRAMGLAMIVLVLAWSLGGVTDELKTADFLVSALGDSLPVWLIPALVFVLAAFTAFATGSSWGAMGILTPLVIPLTWAVMKASGHDAPEDMHIMYSSIASILAGSVWGDHCSPISDTTILSSMASGCDHMEHVRTQIPYAFLVGIVALGLCSIPVAMGLPWWLALLASAVILAIALKVLGRQARALSAAD